MTAHIIASASVTQHRSACCAWAWGRLYLSLSGRQRRSVVGSLTASIAAPPARLSLSTRARPRPSDLPALAAQQMNRRRTGAETESRRSEKRQQHPSSHSYIPVRTYVDVKHVWCKPHPVPQPVLGGSVWGWGRAKTAKKCPHAHGPILKIIVPHIFQHRLVLWENYETFWGNPSNLWFVWSKECTSSAPAATTWWEVLVLLFF